MAELFIGDDNGHKFILPASQTGYFARDYEQLPYGAVGAFPPAAIEIIPMEEWPDRIADRERGKATLKDKWFEGGMEVLHQGSWPFCHGFAAVESLMLENVLQGAKHILLSASSVAAPVTGFKKAGAWIGNDLKQIIRVGAAPVSLIPMLTITRSDFPAGWEQEAAKFKVTEYAELRPRDFLEHGSALLQGFGVSVGQSHWSHAVLHTDLRDVNKNLKATDHNRYGVEFPNSWGTGWGNNGWAIQVGSKKFADEAYVVRQVTV